MKTTKCVLKNTKEFNNCLVKLLFTDITEEELKVIIEEDQRIDRIFNRPITEAENYFIGETEMFDTRDSF